MPFTPQQYSINNTNAVVNGWTIQAPAGDIPFETERTNPEEFIAKIGAKGDGTFVYQPDKSGKFRIRVKQNSVDDNKTLHALKDAGSIFKTEFVSAAPNPAEEKASGQYCMISEAPRIVFNSADEAELEWVIITTELIETRK